MFIRLATDQVMPHFFHSTNVCSFSEAEGVVGFSIMVTYSVTRLCDLW